jgi:hypothetical protein
MQSCGLSALAVAIEGYGLHSLAQAKEPTFNTVVSGTLVSALCSLMKN